MDLLLDQMDEWQWTIDHALDMRNVMIKKDQLLERLKANRKQQESKQAEALTNWQAQLTGRIAQIGTDIAKGKFPKDVMQLISDLQRPQDVLKLYDDAIEMVELDTRPELELTAQEFKHFWQDDWDWKRNWTASNSKYLSS